MAEERVTPSLIATLREKFDAGLRRGILLDTKTATGWVYAAIQEIAKEATNLKIAKAVRKPAKNSSLSPQRSGLFAR